MPKLVLRKNKEADENWISVSDLMAGLMMVFLFILIIYAKTIQEKEGDCPAVPEDCVQIIVGLENEIKKLNDRVALLFRERQELSDDLATASDQLVEAQQIVIAWRDIEYEIYRALQNEFADDLERWRAIILPETLTIKFLSPEILFETGSAELSPEFESILDDFMPRYIRLLNKQFREHIEEIRIEGHTSSEWSDSPNSKEAFIKNMALSQERTRTVMEYSLQIPRIQAMTPWMTKTVSANGMSSARLVFDHEGNEDKSHSRRVEFRIKTKTSQVIHNLINKIVSDSLGDSQ